MLAMERRITIPAVTAADDEAFGARLHRQLGEAYRLASVILGPGPEAEEIAHDAAAAAWARRRSLRDPDRFEAWFTRIVVNACRDRLRERRRRPVVSLDAAHAGEAGIDGRMDGGSIGPGHAAADRDALERALRTLEPDEIVVVVLRFWRDLPVESIAERLGIPAGTVKSRLHRGTHKLRAALEPEWTR